MTKKTYRTAQGKVVDLGSIILQNEHTRAVGNMGVNARGDLVDSNNRSVKSRTQQVSRQYRRQITNVSDDPVMISRKAQADQTLPAVAAPKPVTHAMPVTHAVPVAELSVPDPPKNSGLAAAIAKARAIKQEPVKPTRQLKQEQTGVTKI